MEQDTFILAVRDWRSGLSENLADSSRHTFYLTLTGTSRETRTVCEDDVRFVGVERPGAVSFVPAGRLRWSRTIETESRFVSLRLSPARVARLLGDQGARPLSGRSFTNAERPRLARALASLADAARAVAYDRMAQDAATLEVVGALAGPVEPTPTQPLVTTMLRRTERFVEDNLSESIDLATLAALHGMNAWRFSRVFKAGLGLSPYRFVTHVRLRRAKAMMHDSSLSVARIALAVGFYDEAHFANAFRRYTGATPAAYRRGL